MQHVAYYQLLHNVCITCHYLHVEYLSGLLTGIPPTAWPVINPLCGHPYAHVTCSYSTQVLLVWKGAYVRRKARKTTFNSSFQHFVRFLAGLKRGGASEIRCVNLYLKRFVSGVSSQSPLFHSLALHRSSSSFGKWKYVLKIIFLNTSLTISK